MSVDMIFESWRAVRNPRQDWGLAWYLAWQFCRRYYASHGIVPYVAEHEGLGYYGIQLDQVECRINGKGCRPLGRMTMTGDVENWLTGSPGDHGLDTARQCEGGAATELLVSQAIRFMGIPAIPAKSHVMCRHKRWGGSYELVFEIATIIALRTQGEIRIWNAPFHTHDVVRKADPKAAMTEHPGAFLFTGHGKDVLVAGDGRLLDGSGRDLWSEYMQGASPSALARSIEQVIGR